MDGMADSEVIPLLYGKVYRDFLRKALACILLPLSLNGVLILGYGTCYGTAKISQYTSCLWKIYTQQCTSHHYATDYSDGMEITEP